MKMRYLFLALLTFPVLTGLFSCSKNKNTSAPVVTVLYQTNFTSDGGKWVVGDILKGGSTYYQNGSYMVVGGNDMSTFTYSYTDDFFSNTSDNIAIQASVKAVNGYTNGPAAGNAGLIWNFQSSGQGSASYYVIEIKNTGLWGIFQYQLANSATQQWTITTIAAMVANSVVKRNDFNILQIKKSN